MTPIKLEADRATATSLSDSKMDHVHQIENVESATKSSHLQAGRVHLTQQDVS